MGEAATMGQFTVLFAGGGTGGHLMPGLSVAQELRRRYPECRPVFAGSSRELERRLVEAHGFEFHSLPSVRFNSSMLAAPFVAPGWVMRMTGGMLAGWRLLQRLRPSAVLSLGGYAAVPSAMAAVLANVPMVVMEQNAIPGKANRLLAWWAREVYVPWPGTEMLFPHAERVQVTGNPVRTDLHKRRGRKLAVRFGLSPRKRTLLVMGGSQGARFVNQAVLASLDRLARESSWLQILHSAGEAHYDEVKGAYEKAGMDAAVFPYIEDMASAYAVCDLAFCRAGGTTLAELTSLGVPAVLVPLPSAANDHQRRNASMVAGEGGAIIADQADLDNHRLPNVLLNLLRNEPCLDRMRKASLRLGRPAAAASVVDRVISILEEDVSAGMLPLVETAIRR